MNPFSIKAEILALTAEQKALKASTEKDSNRREVLLAQSSLAALQSREILGRERSSTLPETASSKTYGKCKSVLRQLITRCTDFVHRLCEILNVRKTDN